MCPSRGNMATRRSDLAGKDLHGKWGIQGCAGKIEEILRSGQVDHADEALYLMGVIYAHPKNPGASLNRSIESFQILIKKHPQSDRRQEAVAWISKLRKIRTMEKEILDLKDQIDKLKKIDLGIEEKKRRNLPH